MLLDFLYISLSQIKLWSIPETGLTEALTTPECTLNRAGQQARRIENVVFHPVADFLLTTSSVNAMTLWDIHKQQEISSNVLFISDNSEVKF